MELPEFKARPEFGVYVGDVSLEHIPTNFVWLVDYNRTWTVDHDSIPLKLSIDTGYFYRAAKKYKIPTESFADLAEEAAEYLTSTEWYVGVMKDAQQEAKHHTTVSDRRRVAMWLESILRTNANIESSTVLTEKDVIYHFLGVAPIPDEKIFNLL